jgi:Kef-type K+ transport system membrane component KefB
MQYLGMILFVITTGGAGLLLLRFDIPPPWRYLIAAISVLPSILIAMGMLRAIRKQDELFQRIQFEAIAIAAVLTWLFTFSWGSLEVLNVVPKIPTFVTASALVLFYGVGGWLRGKKYQ